MTNWNTNLSAAFLANEAANTDDLEEELNARDLPVNSGTPAVRTGKFDGARFVSFVSSFRGGNSDSELDLHTGGQSYTIAFWTQLLATSGTRYAMQKWQAGGSGNEWLFRYDGGGAKTVDFYCRTDAPATKIATSGNTLASAVVWYLIVAGYDADSGEIFISVDGEARKTTSLAGAEPNVPSPTLNDIIVGYFSTSTSDWEGDIDHIFLWKGRAFSDAEIAEFYNSGSGVAYPFPGPIEAGVEPHVLAFSDEAPFFGRVLPVDNHLESEHLTTGGIAYTIAYIEVDDV
jgi:hypothetical protein